ncbi:class I SAM-dependent methyltransferase [Candidatus Omnitrophota bacterium]
MKTKEPLYTREGIDIFAETGLSTEEFDDSYFDFLFDIEENNFWFKGRRELIFQIIRKFIPHYKDKKMLEIGCSGGNVLSFLQRKGIEVEGADIFFHALKLAKSRVSTTFYQIDVKDIPFEDEFDIIGLFDVLEHIQDEEIVLENVYRSLKPKGYLLLTVPALASLWSYFDEAVCHKRRYQQVDLVSKLKRQGFSIIKTTFFSMFLLPIFVLRRKFGLGRFSRRQIDNVKDELSLKPILNILFLQLIRFENLLIPFCSLPIGASLLILAKKPESDRGFIS